MHRCEVRLLHDSQHEPLPASMMTRSSLCVWHRVRLRELTLRALDDERLTVGLTDTENTARQIGNMTWYVPAEWKGLTRIMTPGVNQRSTRQWCAGRQR